MATANKMAKANLMARLISVTQKFRAGIRHEALVEYSIGAVHLKSQLHFPSTPEQAPRNKRKWHKRPRSTPPHSKAAQRRGALSSTN